MPPALIPVVATAVAANIAVNVILPGWAYLPAMAGTGLVTVAIARQVGVSSDRLGLTRGRAGRAALVGLAAGTALAAIVAAGATVPGLRDLYVDERATGIGLAGLAYQVLLRIPLGTALGEELVFRSAILGICLRRWSTTVAVAVSSALFGLWHVLPTLDVLESNASVSGRPAGWIVVGAVLATGAAGAGFAALRLATGHVAAPIVLHAVLNGAAFTAAYLVG